MKLSLFGDTCLITFCKRLKKKPSRFQANYALLTYSTAPGNLFLFVLLPFPREIQASLWQLPKKLLF